MKWEKPTDLHLAPRPRKQPQQSRSVQLVAAIRGACLRILDQEDVAALNTNRIAEVAGVGVAVAAPVVVAEVAGSAVAPMAAGAPGMGKFANSGNASGVAAGASAFSETAAESFLAPAFGASGVDGMGTEAPVLPFTVGKLPGNGGSEKSVGCACAWRHQPTVISVTNLSCLAITFIIHTIS